MKSKKSIQLSQAFGAVLTLVLVAVLVIVAIVIFVQLAASFAGTTSVTINNETLTAVTEAGVAITGATLCQFNDFSVTEIYNETENAIVPTNNYTVDASAGTVTYSGGAGAGALLYNNTDWDVTGTYTWGSGACDASESMTTEFGNYTSLIGLVGTIIFLGLVIGILVTAFAFGGRRET